MSFERGLPAFGGYGLARAAMAEAIRGAFFVRLIPSDNVFSSMGACSRDMFQEWAQKKADCQPPG